jgi:asparagine synthase (glutamine-hydrolysing)
MCGIFALLNNDNQFKQSFIEKQFVKGQGRGPEFSKLQSCALLCLLGFHRLAINGLNDISNQPIINGEITLICNGEIYNYKELYAMMNDIPKTDSDCEIIIHLYKRYGIKQTLQLLDGVFAFVLIDYDIESDYASLYVARDPFGVRPLYQLTDEKSQTYGFASELKSLSDFIGS